MLVVEGAVGVVDLGALRTVVRVEAALALLLDVLLGVVVGLLARLDAETAPRPLVGKRRLTSSCSASVSDTSALGGIGPRECIVHH